MQFPIKEVVSVVGKGQLNGGGWGKSFNIPIKEKGKMNGKISCCPKCTGSGAACAGREQCVHEERVAVWRLSCSWVPHIGHLER